MQDRTPLYPGRVKLVPVEGQENTYDMVRADEPTQEGDPLSKATFLKDATAALYGLGTDAVPDDVLALLSRFNKGLGNEYVWAKNKTEDVINYNTYQGPGTNANVCPASSPRYIRFGTEFTVDDSNHFEILNPTDFYFSYSGNNLSELSVLAGKYYLISLSASDFSASLYLTKCESDSIPIVESNVVKMSNCTIYSNPSKTLKITSYGYLNSPDPNAYPPSVSDGYTYTALGQLGAIGKPEIGTYIGTGNSACSIVYEKTPKFVAIFSKKTINASDYIPFGFYAPELGSGFITYPQSSQSGYCYLDSCYLRDNAFKTSNNYMDISGRTYQYIFWS